MTWWTRASGETSNRVELGVVGEDDVPLSVFPVHDLKGLGSRVADSAPLTNAQLCSRRRGIQRGNWLKSKKSLEPAKWRVVGRLVTERSPRIDKSEMSRRG